MSSQEAVSEHGECPICHGLMVEFYKVPVEITEILEDGSEKKHIEQHEVARPCPRCTVQLQAGANTGIPAQFQDAEIEKFDFGIYGVDLSKLRKIIKSYCEQFEMVKESGKGLYLWSATAGSGKTYLSCCILRTLILQSGIQGRFVTAVDYLAAVGKSYEKGRERGETDPSAVYRTCSVLVLDDLGTQKNGEWQEQELFRLIDTRLNNGLVTLITSNLPPENLNLNFRIVDRVLKSSIILQMPEVSVRRAQAEREQEKFLSKLLGGGA